MKRRKPVFKISSYGENSKWDRNSKKIPKILNFTTEIKTKIDNEFGYILNIKQGKGEILTFKIDHPPFKDEYGKIGPSFTGEQFIRTNDYEFYLGDCVWEPLEDKLGNWELTTYHRGKVIANKIFKLIKKNPV